MTLAGAPPRPIQVGVLTKGRPMLAIVIANLVLQEEYPIEIFVVDTGDEPAIKRVDVVSVLRLAQDRNVRCEYEIHRDRNRAFSSGYSSWRTRLAMTMASIGRPLVRMPT